MHSLASSSSRLVSPYTIHKNSRKLLLLLGKKRSRNEDEKGNSQEE
jgi:hypothetical protein